MFLKELEICQCFCLRKIFFKVKHFENYKSYKNQKPWVLSPVRAEHFVYNSTIYAETIKLQKTYKK